MNKLLRSNTPLSIINSLADPRSSFLGVFDDWWNNLPLVNNSPIQTDLNGPKFNAYRKDYLGGPCVVVDLFLPYAKPEHLTIDADDAENSITIKVANHQDPDIKEGDYYIRQMPRGSSHSTFTFEKGWPVKGAKADFTNGMLRLTVPSVVEERTKNTRTIKLGK